MKKQVLVSVDRGETRVALLEATGQPGAASEKPETKGRGRTKKVQMADGYRVAELYFERRGNRSIVGNIYKGKVDNVLPGLEAAFVDFGLDKNGFLHVDEIVIPGVEIPRRGRGGGGGGGKDGAPATKITDLLKPGQEIVVQVVKDPLKTKGARLSMELTIAGRYMVYTPTGEGVGVSKRLDDKERERLRKEVKALEMPSGGAIVRTAAYGAKRRDFEREALYLHKLHQVLHSRVETTPAPGLVFQEADLAVRVVRDIFSANFERAIVDDEKQHQRLVSFFTRTAPELVERVELWQDSTPLFEAYGVEKTIDGLFSKRVDLPSGGYLIIEYTEALTVIDVNSGSYVGRGKGARLEDVITKTNLEAAEEVVNQLRLRDIGGIIVIDFIDMARARNRDAVMKIFRKSLDEDRTRTFTAEISKLGLVEMTRQNVTEGVREVMSTICPTCEGEGVIRSEATIAIEFERQLRDLANRATRGIEAFLVRMHPAVSSEFTQHGARVLHQLETETGVFFHFTGTEGLALDHFEVVEKGKNDEILEEAVPFKAGDEVLVQIVEPHMYNVDDAVAKIDGYVISVEGAGRYVGVRRLVRIDEAGRTSAVAVLVPGQEEPVEDPKPKARATRQRASAKPKVEDAEEEVDAADVAVALDDGPDAEGSTEEEAVDSKPRRRGRRGGRRRSASKAADATSSE